MNSKSVLAALTRSVPFEIFDSISETRQVILPTCLPQVLLPHLVSRLSGKSFIVHEVVVQVNLTGLHIDPNLGPRVVVGYGTNIFWLVITSLRTGDESDIFCLERQFYRKGV